ncbi:TetR/AcrR family transcriptional regulator [Marinitenerispora sediminis]|uniref:TetR/AcrR family transcriptional regulator n=1 Tax=Marinitenerispora sediminis TaxID=1931232 RepID=UPI001F3181B2|nr:TetR/AcrR family transcriptional regulator C-terminal domain-containing protein [Marinitenerispora sediminis]
MSYSNATGRVRNNAGLTTERIVTEALRIIDGQGLGRLTMRRLGDAMSVEAMAIYHHFPLGKEQLFDAIVEHITDVSPAPPRDAVAEDHTDEDTDPDAGAEEAPQDDRPWDERLRSWAHDYRAALLRHSGALSLMINRRPDTPSALRSQEIHYAAFEEAGLAGADIVRAAALLDAYVTGAVIQQVRLESVPNPQAPVVDGRYPHVAALQGTVLDADARFEAGLAAVLASVTAPAGRSA